MCMNIKATMTAYHEQVVNTANHNTLSTASSELSRLNRLSRAKALAASSLRRREPINPYCVESMPIPEEYST